MPKVRKPKTKSQKQKQKQRQTVIVNVNTGRRGSTNKKRSSSTASVRVPYPVYLNSPSDYAPIIHNLPQQFTNQPAITLPVKALANIQEGATKTYPTPTQLQTPIDDVRPLNLSIKPQGYINVGKTHDYIKKEPILSVSSLIQELKTAQSSPSFGLRPSSLRLSEPPIRREEPALFTEIKTKRLPRRTKKEMIEARTMGGLDIDAIPKMFVK